MTAYEKLKKKWGNYTSPGDVENEAEKHSSESNSSGSSARSGGEPKRGKIPQYSKVPNSIVIDPDLTSQECRLLIRLIYFARKEQYCYPSQSRLAAELKLSRSQVHRILKALEKKGKIKISEPDPEKYPDVPPKTQSKIYDLSPLKDYSYWIYFKSLF